LLLVRIHFEIFCRAVADRVPIPLFHHFDPEVLGALDKAFVQDRHQNVLVGFVDPKASVPETDVYFNPLVAVPTAVAKSTPTVVLVSPVR